MSRNRPQWQLQALAAQRRDTELRRAEELKKVANYFEAHTNASKHHEQWTTEGYYQKASKEAELYSAKKIRAAKLEERRKKLELMLFKENMEYQEELKILRSQPKYFKNGSYLNKVPTSVLKEVNQGIIEKENAMRRQEAELKMHHAWRLRQPELRAATAFIANGKLKSAWTEQIIEKEMQKKKEAEENRKALEERDELLKQEIKVEEARMKQKEEMMMELRYGLEAQISELNEKENIVKKLRQEEEKQLHILEELRYIASEREKELQRLTSERDAYIVNMGLHKYKLKQKVLKVMKEIEFDMEVLENMKKAILKDYEQEKDKRENQKRVVEQAMRELEEHRARERQRQKSIDAMYDGEARQINQKQDKLWKIERKARANLMTEVLSTLKKQVEEKIEENKAKQRANVLEREKILEDMERYHNEVKAKERQTQMEKSSYSAISALQSELNNLKLKKQHLDEVASREADIRKSVQHEQNIRKEIAKMQREGSAQFTDRRQAWM